MALCGQLYATWPLYERTAYLLCKGHHRGYELLNVSLSEVTTRMYDKQKSGLQCHHSLLHVLELQFWSQDIKRLILPVCTSVTDLPTPVLLHTCLNCVTDQPTSVLLNACISVTDLTPVLLHTCLSVLQIYLHLHSSLHLNLLVNCNANLAGVRFRRFAWF